MKSMVHVWKFIFYLFLTVVTGMLFGSYVWNRKWILAILFLTLFVVYAYQAFAINGALITIDEMGVERNILGIKKTYMTWDEIHELGIVGINVLAKKVLKNTGKRYIYFSPCEMRDGDRLEMCMSWPPREKIYVNYNPKRYEWILKNCKTKPVYYNVGDLMF